MTIQHSLRDFDSIMNEDLVVSVTAKKGLFQKKEATDRGDAKYFLFEQEAYQNMYPLQTVNKDYEVMKQ